MRKFLIVVSVFIAVQGFSALAMAGALLKDLCGTTVTTNTEVSGTTESFAGPCTITVTTGVQLGLKFSTIEVVTGGKSGDLTINGLGSASLEFVRNSTFSADHIDVEGNFNILTTTGSIELVSNSGTGSGNNIGIVTGGHFCVDSLSGSIELNDNDIDAGSDLCITTTTGPIELKRNIVPGLTTAGNLTIETDSGKIEVRRNDTDSTGDTTIRSDSGNVELRSNNPVNVGGNLLIESDTNKVEVRNNTFGVSGTSTVSGSPCQTKNNGGTAVSCS